MGRVGAVILAAGGSSRLGQPKQLLSFRGETLVARVVRVAMKSGCDPVVVVVGENGNQIRTVLEGPGPTIVENAEWPRGIGTSIHCGLLACADRIDAVVLLTCDQPFVDAAHISKLIATQATTGKAVVASAYAQTLGVPALFDRTCFDALLALPPDAGAKSLISARSKDAAAVAFEEAAIDIDTPADFERLIAERE